MKRRDNAGDWLAPYLWSMEAGPQALESVCRQSGLSAGDGASHASEPRPVGLSLENLAAELGIEAQPVDVNYHDAADLLRGAPPALLRVTVGDGEKEGCLALIRGGSRRVTVLTPEGRRRRLRIGPLVDAITAAAVARAGRGLDPLLDRTGIVPRRRREVRRGLAAERLRGAPVVRGWCLRLPPEHNFLGQLRHEGAVGDFVRFVAIYTLSYCLLLASWWTLGKGALEGRLVAGWLVAWALLLATLIPFRFLSLWSRSLLVVRLGALLKRRLLAGTLRLGSDEMRTDGAGRFLSRVIESEEVESRALWGGFLAIVGTIELVLSVVVLGQGAAPRLHVALALAWAGLCCWLGWRFLVHRRLWTAQRLAMTHALIERMVGHRTRLAQEPRESWHDEEDRELDLYQRMSETFDQAKVLLMGIGARGWMVVGLAALAPAFVAGDASRMALAVGLGGVIAAHRGFAKVTEGFSHLTGAWVGWEQVRTLFRAAERVEPPGSARLLETRATESASGTLLETTDLRFRHQGRAEEVLAGCSLTVRFGDRLLLEGPSGGGKSTLAAVLAAQREPEAGLRLLGGLDPETWGKESWRRRVVAVPQFHENHIVTESLAFNLLMGRGWPPSPQDLEEAETICRKLGLGELLDRMPAQLQQLVGETGWQLSHGEKSRVYLARALLQDGDLLILDESFAALDPATQRIALECTLDHAATLLVIAHP